MTVLAPAVERRADPAVVGYPIVAALFVLAATVSFGVAPGAVVLLVVLTGLAVWSNTSVLTGRYLNWYALILGVKLMLLVYQIQFKNLPLSGVDWVYYHRFGAQLATELNGDLLAIVTSPDWDLFTRLTAVVYSVFGAAPEQVYFFVFITSLLTFRYIYGAAELFLRDRRSAQRVALLFMVWPNEIVLSVTFLREMPIQMLVAASLYHFLRYWRDRSPSQLLVALAMSLAATAMHSGVIALPVIYAYLAIRARDRGGLQLGRTIVYAVAVVLLLSAPIAAPLLSKFGDLSQASTAVDLGGDGGVEAVAATTYYLNPNLGDAPLVQLPYRLVMFALSPLPWQANTAGTALAVAVEGLPRLFMVAMLLMAFNRCRTGTPKTDVPLLGLLAMVLATYVIFSVGVSTYGTAMRHRAKIFPIEIILAYGAWSMARLNEKRNAR